MGGALLASAVWAAGVFAVGDRGDGPELHGYHYVENLCTVTEIGALRSAGYENAGGGNLQFTGVAASALDMMSCRVQLDNSKNPNANGFLVATANLHKEVDPAVEFAAFNTAQAVGQNGVKIDTAKLTGLGDEAYRRVETSPSMPNNRTVSLSIRDGGLVFEVSLTQPMVAQLSTSDPAVFSADATVDFLRSVAAASMARLRS
ncbi:hypothetical protein ACFVUS_16755 [Nocardia sp. NPDC058058]|uniref:hypothetical protein n=1 Tax=Nocardia sp. NPDC058058 TaxID=3346317 RepID=UPI0036DF26A0